MPDEERQEHENLPDEVEVDEPEAHPPDEAGAGDDSEAGEPVEADPS